MSPLVTTRGGTSSPPTPLTAMYSSSPSVLVSRHSPQCETH
jgi:hypothetical protein